MKRICFPGVRRRVKVGSLQSSRTFCFSRKGNELTGLSDDCISKPDRFPKRFCFHFSHETSEGEARGREEWWGLGLPPIPEAASWTYKYVEKNKRPVNPNFPSLSAPEQRPLCLRISIFPLLLCTRTPPGWLGTWPPWVSPYYLS